MQFAAPTRNRIHNRRGFKKTQHSMKDRSMKRMTSSSSFSSSIPLKKTNSQLEYYPASPPIIGQQIVHFGHPHHHLNQIDLPDLFTCAGCKEYGSGKRFTCQQCDFQLHEFCGLAPKQLKPHPLHIQHQLLFSTKPVKGGILKSKCDVCGKTAKGYTFRCNACSYQMHPCCAMLSNEMNISVHPHKLTVMPIGSEAGFACGECKRSKRSGRLYRCTVCDYYLHAVCAKNMVNGLEANGIKPIERPTVFGTAARLASQVIIEFIGGLVEGLGEGVGQALIQSVARGRRPTPRPPTRTQSLPSTK